MKPILSIILLGTTLLINTVEAKSLTFTNSQATSLTNKAAVEYWNRQSDSKLHITHKTPQNIQCDLKNINTLAICSVQISNHPEIFSKCGIRTRKNKSQYKYCFITGSTYF